MNTKEANGVHTICVWRHVIGHSRGQCYESGCGKQHWFNEGTPDTNGFRFCPFCGRTLAKHWSK